MFIRLSAVYGGIFIQNCGEIELLFGNRLPEASLEDNKNDDVDDDKTEKKQENIEKVSDSSPTSSDEPAFVGVRCREGDIRGRSLIVGAQWLEQLLHDDDALQSSATERLHVCVCVINGRMSDENISFVVVPPATEAKVLCREVGAKTPLDDANAPPPFVNTQTVFGLQLDSSMYVCPEGTSKFFGFCLYFFFKKNCYFKKKKLWFNFGQNLLRMKIMI